MTARPAPTPCPSCDALHQRTTVVGRQRAYCRRCGSPMPMARPTHLPTWFALAIGAALAFLIANGFPIVEMHLRGEHTRATLPGALWATWDAGAAPVAVLAGLCALLFPLLTIALQCFTLGSLVTGRRPAALRPALRAVTALHPWNMVDVFLLAVLVSVAKLRGEPRLILDAGLAGFMLLSVLMILLSAFDTAALWERADARRPP